jgi:hypothetical protein
VSHPWIQGANVGQLLEYIIVLESYFRASCFIYGLHVWAPICVLFFLCCFSFVPRNFPRYSRH